ncbi:hypothetical protein ACIPQJ_23630 [Streptomyces sp. NPDC090082]|uniref:hypothetical protein n=1 Tax=unclassified Streptomyces TaxID=2593676 RepID=UPI0037F7C617
MVGTTVRLAGRSFVAKLSVDNRPKRETPVLLGRQEVQGLHVAVGKRLLTQPDSTAPLGPADPVRQGARDRPVSMMALLPLAALLIVQLRVAVGLTVRWSVGVSMELLPEGRGRVLQAWCRRLKIQSIIESPD